MKNPTIAFICLLLVVPCQARIIFVDVNTPDNNDGSSWAKAYKYLQDALADANSTGDVNEIRVAQGIYTPDSNSADPNGSGDREATFHLINSVAIKGGFAGFGQPDPNARDIELYETILSGDLLDNDDPCTPVDGLLDDPCRADNSYHLFYHPSGTDLNATAILDGFIITAANANGSAPHDLGGGMYNDNSSPAVTNCTFSGNSAYYGGGMYNDGYSNPTVTNCTFKGNSARGGGGMYNGGGSSPTVTNCKFSKNSASNHNGGGMCNGGGSNPTVTNCIFSRNSAYWGGGMSSSDSPTVTNCTFTGNSARYGGGMSNGSGSNPTVTNCTFSGNSARNAGRGGGMYNITSSPTLTNCTFSGNSSDWWGGAIYSYNYQPTSSPTLTNCTFSGNSALNGGNACAVDSSQQNYQSNVEMTNCILWDGGQEVWNNDGSTITISYTDLQGGQAACYDPCDAIVWSLGNIDADPCFFVPGYWHPNDTPADANDDFWLDGDYHLKSEAGRWQPSIYAPLDPTADRFINLLDFAAFASLWCEKGSSIPADMDRSGLVDFSDLALLLDSYLRSYKLGLWVIDEVTSPCIDAGDPNSDWTAELWPHGKCINMGAYGGTPQASMSPLTIGNIANLDNDPTDNVDFDDLSLFISKWLKEEILIPEDLNRDGVVNLFDYAIFAEHWLED